MCIGDKEPTAQDLEKHSLVWHHTYHKKIQNDSVSCGVISLFIGYLVWMCPTLEREINISKNMSTIEFIKFLHYSFKEDNIEPYDQRSLDYLCIYIFLTIAMNEPYNMAVHQLSTNQDYRLSKTELIVIDDDDKDLKLKECPIRMEERQKFYKHTYCNQEICSLCHAQSILHCNNQNEFNTAGQFNLFEIPPTIIHVGRQVVPNPLQREQPF